MSRVVSKKLRETRLEKNLTLEQISNATHIRLRYLEAMESGDFNSLPSQLQVKGFIRSYGGYLGLDAEALIDALDLDPWIAMETLKDESEREKTAAEEDEVDSSANFRHIGDQLQSQREVLGLTLEDVAQHTHLRIRYLKALEVGNMKALPSSVQGRGMLKNYATFLGLDADQLLLEFADGLQARLVESAPSREPSRPVRPRSRAPRRERQFLSRDLVIGILLGLFLVLFIIWGAIQVTALRAGEDIEPTAPSIAQVLNPSATPSPIPTLPPTVLALSDENTETGIIVERSVAEQTQEVIFVSERLEGAVQVQIAAQQRAWMRVTVDGEVEFDGRIVPGNIYGFAGEEFVEITTGNAAGLQVFYNDQDLGILGNFGEVVNFVINIDGVQTPTPTITLSPTATATETPEITPTPTQ